MLRAGLVVLGALAPWCSARTRSFFGVRGWAGGDVYVGLGEPRGCASDAADGYGAFSLVLVDVGWVEWAFRSFWSGFLFVFVCFICFGAKCTASSLGLPGMASGGRTSLCPFPHRMFSPGACDVFPVPRHMRDHA